MPLSSFTSVFRVTLQTWMLLVSVLMLSFHLKLCLDRIKKEVDILAYSCKRYDKPVQKLSSHSSGLQYLSSKYPSGTDKQRVSPPSNLEDDVIVIYNKVPKTGSTTVSGLAYDLSERNNIHVLYFEVEFGEKAIGLDDQLRFIMNITGWTHGKPALYHGHVSFIDTSRFGVQKPPIYINMVREPLDRLVSYYYFRRYGDDFEPGKIRARAGNNQTFDECVRESRKECDPARLWVQIPYFCGHDPVCSQPGNKWALQEAKKNLARHYLVVGVTEELGSFVSVLEALLPNFFSGATDLFHNGPSANLRRTSQKIALSASTEQKLKSSLIYRMEREFYEFAFKIFRFTKQTVLSKQKRNTFAFF